MYFPTSFSLNDKIRVNNISKNRLFHRGGGIRRGYYLRSRLLTILNATSKRAKGNNKPLFRVTFNVNQFDSEFALTETLPCGILRGMFRLGKSQRSELSKALFDVGKLVFAALVIGQFISASPFRTGIFVAGLLFFIATFAIATLLIKEGD